VTIRLSDLKETARVVALPLKTKFRGLTSRELMLFEGPNGFTEWAAFGEYSTKEASLWLRSAIEWGFEKLPTPVRTKVGVNAILPACPLDEIHELLPTDARSVKIKVAEVGQQVAEDVKRILKVREILPQAKIRLDANGALSNKQTIHLVETLLAKGIELEYFEQPVATNAELSELREELVRSEISLLIAADEALRKSSDPVDTAGQIAADILVIKSAPLGGIWSALEVSQATGLPVVPSSAMQSSIGLAAELHFAASIPALQYDCGLGTSKLFAADLTDEPLIASEGYLELRRPDVSKKLLNQFELGGERRTWWLNRLEACAEILELEP
jgi:o-succinylbenzoate synthase